MDNSARREKILQLLQGSPSPITGTALAKACDVSRQIIVGDVALMRAQGTDIISTPRGYQLVTPVVPGCTRVFVCCHGLDQMEGELNAIVDNGGHCPQRRHRARSLREPRRDLEPSFPSGCPAVRQAHARFPCGNAQRHQRRHPHASRRSGDGRRNSRPSARPCATSASYIKN